MIDELLSEKENSKDESQSLKSYTIWDINKDIKNYDKKVCITDDPDKMRDRISDTLLDLYLETDPNSRCAIETCGGLGKVFITGE